MSDPLNTDSFADRPISIFWTGGWDSSFRVCQLAIDLKTTVQPIFVHSMRKAGGQRLNIMHELQAIEYMQADLYELFPEAAQRVKPIIVISQAELYDLDKESLSVTPGPGLGDGWQYHVLNSIAQRWDHPIELSIEKSDDGHNPVGDSLIPHVEKIGHSYRLKKNLPESLFDPQKADNIHNFRHFHFPLIFTQRNEMCDIAKRGGYLSIIEKSWSCIRYRPDNSQCGECFCCKGRIRDGVWIQKPFETKNDTDKRKLAHEPEYQKHDSSRAMDRRI